MRRRVALEMGTNVSKEPAAVIIRAEELLRYLISQQNIGAVRRKKIHLSKFIHVK
jgi:RNA:NAD 2'-phosphotransferase (TPT1/KptA family)